MTRRLVLVALCAAACAAPSAAPLDDEGWNAQVDPSVAWAPVLGEPRVVVPDRALPVRPLLPSNNNVSIALHEGRLYLAWRSAETHFASANARLHVLSSGDLGKSWVFETTVALGADVREPLLLSFQGRLWLHWFEAGTDPLGFEPRAQWRSERTKDGWAAPERWGRDGEITWELRARQGSAWRAAYLGEHYRFGEGGFPTIELRFERASDGVDWQPLAGDGVVYRGGVSEASFEFDAAGDVWAVTRNEDGDATGFGSHVCVGRHDAPGQ